ncbi:MAG: tyrosine-type recombinase/integrase [Armatimonadota bacterium]
MKGGYDPSAAAAAATKIKWLKREDWDGLVDAAAEERREELLGIRDQAIIALGLSSGLRVSELCNLNVEDLDLKDRRLTVRRGKGGKPRPGRFSEDARDLIEIWLQVRPTQPEDTAREQRGPLWISRKGGRLAARTVREMMQKAGEKAALGHVHPHMLRHSCATELLRKTNNLRQVQVHLGHARITTTEIYAHVINNDLEKAVEDL